MGYYPIMLDLAGRPCLVVGGGAVAERKIVGLLAAGAVVTLISPLVTPTLEQRARDGHIHHRKRAYRAGDLAGMQLAFAASADPVVNAAVFGEGRARGIWVNAADDPEHCDFILPALLQRGDLMVAIATGGGSPALAGVVRDELETILNEDYALLLEIAAAVRDELQQRGLRPAAAMWRAALRDEALRGLIKENRRDEARAYLQERLNIE